MTASSSEPVRLQKVLAAAGVGSRRYCEILIAGGRVRVDGETVSALGTRVDPETAVIHVDGRRIVTATDTVVYALNKPVGVLTTMSDDRGRPCVGDLVADLSERVYHVGRLDAATEGLLLLTNDGDLANRLAHPSHGVAKTYVALVRGRVAPGTVRRIRQGVAVEGRPVEVSAVSVQQRHGDRSLVELVIHEGRNRIVRRLFEEVGHPVVSLARTRVGPIGLGSLPPGKLRLLNSREVRDLYTEAGL